MKHHEFSPSRLGQLQLCPGAHKMQLGMEDVDNEYSTEGNLLHEALATGNLDNLDSDQVDLVQLCNRFLDDMVNDGDIVIREERVEVRDTDDTIITYGTCDIIILHLDKSISIIDWKFGYNPVDRVNKNIQIATYAVGAMQKYNATACNCWVFQPRIYHTSNYTFRNADAIISNIKLIIKKAKAPAYVLNPSEVACRYCLAQSKCVAFCEKFNSIVSLDSGGFDLTCESTVERLYEAGKVAKAMIKRIDDALRSIISDTGKCGKYTITTTKGTRQVLDLNSLYAVAKDYLTINEFTGACKVSISKLEPMIVEKLVQEAEWRGEKLTKTSAKKMVNDMFGGLITLGAGSERITLVKK